MPPGPPPSPGRDDPSFGWDVTGYPVDAADGWRPAPSAADWPGDPQELAARRDEQPPPDPEHDPGWCPDPADPPLPGDPVLEAIRAESRRIAAGRAAERAAEPAWSAGMAAAALAGRRGPGAPGPARRVPGVSAGPAGGFGAGQPLDLAAGGSVLSGFAEAAAGEDDCYAGASDDELAGIIGALDRAEAAASARKHAAVAELVRRRPLPGGPVPADPAQMPAGYDDFAVDEVACVLAENRGTAAAMLELAWTLQVKLPGTKAAFAAGRLRHAKAQVIAQAAAFLDPGEARAAEEKVLGRAGRLTPGG